MFMAFFEFNVKPEKQEDFLKAVREKIKPYWMAQGTGAYNVYRECDAEGNPTDRFIKMQMREGSPDMKTGTSDVDPEAKEVIDLFFSFTENLTFKKIIPME